jgi:hypothetical protein
LVKIDVFHCRACFRKVSATLTRLTKGFDSLTSYLAASEILLLAKYHQIQVSNA